MSVGKIRLHDKVYLIMELDPHIVASLKALGHIDSTDLPLWDMDQSQVMKESPISNKIERPSSQKVMDEESKTDKEAHPCSSKWFDILLPLKRKDS